ncbi:MAG TPA: alpha/beta hydrolase [Burkholderiaceae bacterium]|nr:alpha/beta hydrolase [Burkholderiaceae bacterium]HQR77375.1 alpha/beta hydrolase [Burkholderiaceae bacterium]
MTREAFYEREYNARAAIPEHPRIFARWAEQGALARRLRACLIDLPYGETPAERLDYFPTRQDAAPLLVFIHGGYWRSLDKSDFSWLAPPYVQHGVAVALLNYGLAPQTPMEEIVRQQLRALAWLYRNGDRLGFDPERIVVAGHSAGAHLTAMMIAALWPAYEPDLPASLVKSGLAISGIYDLAPLLQAPFVNVDLKLDARRARLLSPLHLPPATPAPLITAVGALESSEFRRQTTLIGRAWKENLVRSVPMPGTNHLTIVDELANPASPLFDAALELVRASKR